MPVKKVKLSKSTFRFARTTSKSTTPKPSKSITKRK